MLQPIALLGGFLIVVASASILTASSRRARIRARLFQADEPEPAVEASSLDSRSRLAAWLFRAGFRSAGAPSRFVFACVASGVLALGSALLAGAMLPEAQAVALGLPVVGAASAALVSLVPWIAGAWIAAAPYLFVRGARRRRVGALESDLPLVLELLATLAEAGHGFDGSVARVIESQPAARPLRQELRLYQLEVLTGVGRAECLRRLGSRARVPSVDAVVSALVQAEESGSGLADLLRPQADDLRHRRREKALARAESLPEKLVVPLLVGFLPGLLVWTLGPAFHQLFTMIDATMGR